MFLSFEPTYVPKFKVWYSSTNEILTIKEYWNLIGQEHFLVATWEPDFSQACSFHAMLMNQKNFRFTQIPDKTKDMISLKSPKTLFLGHFCPVRIFSKKILLSHTTKLGSLTPCQVLEKTNEPILRKLTDRRKDGQTDSILLDPSDQGRGSNKNLIKNGNPKL